MTDACIPKQMPLSHFLEINKVDNSHFREAKKYNINIFFYKSNRMILCVCICEAKDLANHWTEMVLLLIEVSYRDRKGF